MTVEVTTDFSGPYITNGATTVFPFTFIAMSIVEVAVLLRDADGVDSIASPGLYTVFRSDDGTGSVVFSVAPVSGYDLYVFSDVSFSQSVAFEDGSGWKAAPVNSVADRSAARDIWLKGKVDRALVVPLGETPAELPSVDNRVGKFLAWDAEGNPVAADGTGPDGGLRADLAASGGSALTGFIQSGAGAVARSIQVKNREILSVKDFGAVGDGSTDDTAALVAAAVAARGGMSDPTGRLFAGKIMFPPGKYRINSAAQLAPTGGVTGLTLEGTAAGSATFVYTHPTSTLQAQSSRDVSIRNIGFQSSGIDDSQVAITVPSGANPLRSWTIEKCDFSAFFRAFSVSGSTLCSEFYLSACRFLQCYEMMYNNNPQAVNWSLVNCDWENESLVTALNKDLSAALHLKQGSFVNWIGGSFVLRGMMAYYDLTSSGAFQRTSHAINFSNIRIELEDDGAGGHAPLIDRVASGYTNGSNSPTTSIKDSSILNRGAIPTTVTYAKVWSGCSLEIINTKTEGGKVVGVLDAVTAATPADVYLEKAKGIVYAQDTTARVNSHDQHNVTIIPDYSNADTQPIVDMRLASLSVPSTAYSKRIYVRGPTGSIPQAGTTVNLPPMLDHTVFLKLFCYRFTVAGQALTVLLRNQADTTTYATLTIGVGVTNAEVYVGLEMGIDIPSGTPLMFKMTGTGEVVKGLLGAEIM